MVALDLLNDRAIEVVAVEPDGSAAKAGIRPGDLIVALGGRLLNSIDDLHRLLSGHGSDRQLALSVVRAGRELELHVDLGT
jgi:serine protease DegQ